MEIEKYKTLIMTFIFAVAGIGAGTTINQSELDAIYEQMEDVYVCDSTGTPAYCPGTIKHPEPLSGSAISCYFNNGERDTYSRCTGGVYVPVVEYSEQYEVDIFSLIYEALNIEQPEQESLILKKGDSTGPGVCLPEGCEYFNNR